MVKAIRMPDLHQFKPGFFDLSARCGGAELEHLIIVRYAFFPHGCLRLWQGSVAEGGDWKQGTGSIAEWCLSPCRGMRRPLNLLLWGCRRRTPRRHCHSGRGPRERTAAAP